MAKATFFNKFPEIAEAFGQEAAKLVELAARGIETRAAENCPVDTGALQASIYMRTYTGHDRHDKAKGKDFFPLIKQPPNQYTAYVAVGANYGIFVEMGTVNMPAQPFFDQAVVDTLGPFEQAVGEMEDRIRERIGSFG